MSTQELQNIIIQSLQDYHPQMIGLFGSFRRNEQNENSDIDLLVQFSESLSLLQLIKIENELTEKLGRKVDLVTPGALKNQIVKENILRELMVIYES